MTSSTAPWRSDVVDPLRYVVRALQSADTTPSPERRARDHELSDLQRALAEESRSVGLLLWSVSEHLESLAATIDLAPGGATSAPTLVRAVFEGAGRLYWMHHPCAGPNTRLDRYRKYAQEGLKQQRRTLSEVTEEYAVVEHLTYLKERDRDFEAVGRELQQQTLAERNDEDGPDGVGLTAAVVDLVDDVDAPLGSELGALLYGYTSSSTHGHMWALLQASRYSTSMPLDRSKLEVNLSLTRTRACVWAYLAGRAAVKGADAFLRDLGRPALSGSEVDPHLAALERLVYQPAP